jgi:hypothetical protein
MSRLPHDELVIRLDPRAKRKEKVPASELHTSFPRGRDILVSAGAISDEAPGWLKTVDDLPNVGFFITPPGADGTGC